MIVKIFLWPSCPRSAIVTCSSHPFRRVVYNRHIPLETPKGMISWFPPQSDGLLYADIEYVKVFPSMVLANLAKEHVI